MLIEIRAAPPFMKNGFVLADETTRDGVVIDPGDDVEELLDVVREHDLRIAWILLTHAHFDHITGVRRAREVLGCPVVLHADDLPLYEAAKQQGVAFGFRVEAQPAPDRFYGPDDVFRFGGHQIRAHHTPGHSPGGVCLAVTTPGPDGTGVVAPKTLVVGDTLFAGSIGRTDLPGGDMDTLLASIRNVLFAFGDDAVVYPGHGEPTTIGEERRTNPFLRQVPG